jgi:hypothetical protein
MDVVYALKKNGKTLYGYGAWTKKIPLISLQISFLTNSNLIKNFIYLFVIIASLEILINLCSLGINLTSLKK